MCFIPSPLFADYVDDKLPSDTSTQIREGARRVIDLGVKKRHVIKITKRMLDNKFHVNQVLSAYDVIIKAKKQSLPEAPIMDKLYEGIAKEVQADKIIQAMETVRTKPRTKPSGSASKAPDSSRSRERRGMRVSTSSSSRLIPRSLRWPAM